MRLAPTPSGYLHAGNVLSFSLTVTMAWRAGAKVMLRIDDLDSDRVRAEYVQDIFGTLQFLEIPWEEGPRDVASFERGYSQEHRMDLYRKALEVLRESGSVYGCLCSRSQLRGGAYPGTCRELGLSLDAPGVSWRLRTSAPLPLRVKTWDHGVVDASLPEEMTDFVVRKKDGFPAYQLTSVVDDIHYGVDGIVRGADLWASTLAQQYLSLCLPGAGAFREAVFYHHPLLVGDEGEKLSKSAGATSIQFMRRQGMDAREIYSHIASLLGKGVIVGNWKELAGLII